MPFVHVRSLPLGGEFDPGAAVRAISAAFAREAEVEERHVTVTWQELAGASGSTPLLVELIAPDMHPRERVEAMIRAAGAAVADAAGVAPEDVFVEFRGARSGQVLDGGQIVRW